MHRVQFTHFPLEIVLQGKNLLNIELALGPPVVELALNPPESIKQEFYSVVKGILAAADAAKVIAVLCLYKAVC